MITLAAQAALAANDPVIRVLRLIGARDSYIARAFVRRFTLRALAGAALGTLAGMMAVFPAARGRCGGRVPDRPRLSGGGVAAAASDPGLCGHRGLCRHPGGRLPGLEGTLMMTAIQWLRSLAHIITSIWRCCPSPSPTCPPAIASRKGAVAAAHGWTRFAMWTALAGWWPQVRGAGHATGGRGADRRQAPEFP